eukprot:gene11111-12378_t
MDRWIASCLGPKTALISVNSNRTILALNKACGVLSHPNPSPRSSSTTNKSITLLRGTYDFHHEMYRTLSHDERKEEIRTYLLHRLDEDTSGLILVATEEVAAQTVKDLFKKRQLKKEYQAIVFGRVPTNVSGKLWEDAYASKRESSGAGAHVRAFVPQHGRQRPDTFMNNGERYARTEVVKVEHLPNGHLTLLTLRPITGFAHQLRFQCSRRGWPIVGDDVYGDFALNKTLFSRLRQKGTDVSKSGPSLSLNSYKRLYLHAHHITSETATALDLPNCRASLPDAFSNLTSLLQR